MQNSIILNHFKARLRRIKTNLEKPYNWIFLPGGPGLGSESLCSLTDNLNLPGTIWHLDLPGDGSNLTSNNSYYFERWPEALIEAVQMFNNVILVAHSTGAMYALATPELKGLLYGFVIMDSAPDASWQNSFAEYVRKNPLAEITGLKKIYSQEPTNENLKRLTLASIPYLLSSDCCENEIRFFEHLSYNVQACEWSAQHFDQTYKALWIPNNIPTLIFAGDQDHVTPLALFNNSEEFNHPNIVMRTIASAGHYPWIENFDRVQLAFQEYCERLPLK